MSIPSANFGILMLLDEIHIQCRLFERNIEHLEVAADHWIKMDRGEDFDRSVAPMDILAWCSVCLSAMAAIRHLLVSGRAEPVADGRRRVLREFLGNPGLTNVATPKVRDSWEHLDERLDSIVPRMKSGAISHIHVSVTPPSAGTIALKRFDPVTFTIYFADQGIPLRPAVAEIAMLRARLDEAMRRLQNEVVLPWGSVVVATPDA